MDGNGEDQTEAQVPIGLQINQELIRKLETALREAKSGRWQSGGILLANVGGQVTYHSAVPDGAFAMLLSGCANGFIAKMNEVFKPQQPAILPVQSFQFPQQ